MSTNKAKIGKPVPQHLIQIASRIGRHEASHWVVARTLGFTVGQISVTLLDDFGGHRGGSDIEPAWSVLTLDDVIRYLEARIQVLHAGALGEALFGGKIDNRAALDAAAKGAKNDFDKGRELIHALRNIKYPNDRSNTEIQQHLSELDSDLFNRAAVLVEAESELINGFGQRIAQEFRQINSPITLTIEDLNRLPAVQARWSAGT